MRDRVGRSAARPAIEPLATLDQAALLALNNAHATELSWLPPERLAEMLGQAFYAQGIGDVQAALIAFDQDSAYAGRHFSWFRARYERFVYIDRVVVAPSARGRGLARLLYADLFARARATCAPLLACEVNREPPNPASQRFHASHGFAAVGEARQPEDGKVVTYMTRSLP